MQKSHTIKNKLLDVKKAISKQEMDRHRGDRGSGYGSYGTFDTLLFIQQSLTLCSLGGGYGGRGGGGSWNRMSHDNSGWNNGWNNDSYSDNSQWNSSSPWDKYVLYRTNSTILCR